MFSPQELNQIKKTVTSGAKTLIITHYNPDGDAIGSSMGLKHFLKKMGNEAEVIVPNDFPKFLKWIPDVKNITIAEYKIKKTKDLFYHAEVIFLLDFNSVERSGELVAPWIKNSRAKKILIDHHQQPDGFDFVYSDTKVPATCQMVYHFIEALGEESLVDEAVAQCLYTGIMTDTGGFRFRSTSADTHRIVAKLIEKGADPAGISSNIWDTNSLSRMKLLALILGRMETIFDDKIAILSLKREELKEYGFQKGDTDGFVNYGLSIAGCKMAAFFMEDLHHDFIKISFRSKDMVDCNNFSRKYFDGGGHINAAGGKSNKTLEEAIKFFKEKAQDIEL